MSATAYTESWATKRFEPELFSAYLTPGTITYYYDDNTTKQYMSDNNFTGLQLYNPNKYQFNYDINCMQCYTKNYGENKSTYSYYQTKLIQPTSDYYPESNNYTYNNHEHNMYTKYGVEGSYEYAYFSYENNYSIRPISAQQQIYYTSKYSSTSFNNMVDNVFITRYFFDKVKNNSAEKSSLTIYGCACGAVDNNGILIPGSIIHIGMYSVHSDHDSGKDVDSVKLYDSNSNYLSSYSLPYKNSKWHWGWWRTGFGDRLNNCFLYGFTHTGDENASIIYNYAKYYFKPDGTDKYYLIKANNHDFFTSGITSGNGGTNAVDCNVLSRNMFIIDRYNAGDLGGHGHQNVMFAYMNVTIGDTYTTNPWQNPL